MKKLKYEILFIILFMSIGIAAVSSNLLINGSTPIASNPDDFNVYFSDVLVDGTQDLSLVKSETSLVFTGEFSAVGDKKEITYDVTNASMNYDADIDITCTQSTTYLTITNSFDTDSYLSARSTRTGVLSITLSKSYTGSDLTQDISCTISASAVERTSQGSGSVAVPVGNKLSIGDEIAIGDEKFNIINIGDDIITMLAQYNISPDTHKQTNEQMWTLFSDGRGWDYEFGSDDIDVSVWSPEISSLIDEYILFLQENYLDFEVTGDLLSVTQLENLGCSYDYTGIGVCLDSVHATWLVNGQYCWTKTPAFGDPDHIHFMSSSGEIDNDIWSDYKGVRPVITVSKGDAEALKQFQTYTIGEVISIADENFNVISQTPTTVTMLAQYNLGTDYIQSTTENGVSFAEETGWIADPGPQEIDIQVWTTNPKTYVNEYVSFLQAETGDATLSGDLITVAELGNLGCSITSDYSYEVGNPEQSLSCNDSTYFDWLVNAQNWWTQSAVSNNSLFFVWGVGDTGVIRFNRVLSQNVGTTTISAGSNGIRPVITISKETLKNLG